MLKLIKLYTLSMCSSLHINYTSIQLFKEKAPQVLLTHSNSWASCSNREYMTETESWIAFHLPTLGHVQVDKPLHPLWTSFSFWLVGSFFSQVLFSFDILILLFILAMCARLLVFLLVTQWGCAAGGFSCQLTLLWDQNRLVSHLSFLSVLLVSVSPTSKPSSSAAPT